MAPPIFPIFRGPSSVAGSRGISPAPIGLPVRTPPVSQPSTTSGRVGVSGNQAKGNVATDGFQFARAYAGPSVDTIALSDESDWVGMNFTVTLNSIVGNTSTTADLLTVIQQIDILGAGGTPISLTPAVDFYDFAQRFSRRHIRPAVVELNGTTSVSGTYNLVGVNLPRNGSGYSIRITTAAFANVGSSTTAYNVTIRLAMNAGDCGGRMTNFQFSGMPFGVSAGGVQNLGTVAAFPDVPLVELFITGMTSNVADIDHLEIEGVTPLVYAADMTSKLTQEMESPVPTTELWLCLALHSDLTLSRGKKFLLYFGSAPSTTMRLGYYWLS